VKKETDDIEEMRGERQEGRVRSEKMREEIGVVT
jgi:hypothetical protein